MNKRAVLFVDDDPGILEGMRLTMHSMRKEWNAFFATNANEAMAAISARDRDDPFDVVVTDIRMPGQDGVALLRLVQQCSPGTVRIILSGYSDHESNLQSVKAAHQFLSKPCNATVLKESLSRAAKLGRLLQRESIRRMLLNVESLLTLPPVVLELNRELELPEPSLEKIGRLVEGDPALSATLLKVVNSAFFGLFHDITSPAQAVTYLGTEIMRGLVLGIHLFEQVPENSPLAVVIKPLWRHGLQVGQYAKAIALMEGVSQASASNYFVAGMLHDIGKLIFAMHDADAYAEALRLQAEEGQLCEEAERALFGVDHAEAGGGMLGIWGLPADIFTAVQWHHSLPAERESHPEARFTPAVAVHVANGVDMLQSESPGGLMNASAALPCVDPAALEARGLASRIPEWRRRCQEKHS